MLLQVHDELVFEVPEADAARASEVIRRVMEGAAEPTVNLSVPLGVEIGTGPNWGEAHCASRLRAMKISRRGGKSTRLTPVTNAQIVCRLLLEKTNNTNT